MNDFDLWEKYIELQKEIEKLNEEIKKPLIEWSRKDANEDN